MPASLQLLADLISSGPAERNGYQFAAERALRLFIPHGSRYITIVLSILGVIYILLGAACVHILVQRSRKLELWWLSIGVCIVPHVTNVSLAANAAFAVTGIANIILVYFAYRRDSALHLSSRRLLAYAQDARRYPTSSWSGSVTVADLDSFAGLINQANVVNQRCGHWIRIGFGCWLACVLILNLLWLPLMARFFQILRWQVRSLGESKMAANQARARIAEIDQDEDAQYAPRLKVATLLGIIKFRGILIVCITLAIFLYGTILSTIVANSEDLLVSSHRFYATTMVALIGYLFTAVPAIIAAQFGQQKLTKDEPALTTTLWFQEVERRAAAERQRRDPGRKTGKAPDSFLDLNDRNSYSEFRVESHVYTR